MENDAVGCLRFGVTVGKRNAHRSVDRAMVKRILREAARLNASRLEALLAQSDQAIGLDVSLRLKAPISCAGTAERHEARKRCLAQDAAKLLAQLELRMQHRYVQKGDAS